VDDTVDKDESLIAEALSQFRNYYDFPGAAKFALRLAIPLHKLPQEIQLEMKKINPDLVVVPDTATVQKWDEDWDLVETLPRGMDKPSSMLLIWGLTPNISNSTRFSHVRFTFLASGPRLKIGRSLTPVLNTPSRTGLMESGQAVVTNSTAGSTAMASPLSKLDEDELFYYKMPISLTQVAVVDTPQKVDVFLHQMDTAVNLQKDAPLPMLVVGFDSEWKPMFAEAGVALVQIALADKVFLLDVYQLKRFNVNSGCWLLLLQRFFKNEVSHSHHYRPLSFVLQFIKYGSTLFL